MVPFVLAATLTKAAPPSASAYYIAALHATRATLQPAVATYTEHLSSSGMKFSIIPDRDDADFALGYGKEMRSALVLNASYSSERHGVAIQGEGKSYRVRAPLFNPTWSGVEDWLKYGFYGPDRDVAVTHPTPSPTPDSQSPRTIAVVSAVDPGAYHIDDGGAATCENGSQGHRLLLRPLGDPDRHPLRSVIVDVATARICTMAFRMGAATALSFTGAFELHLGSVGDYWLIKDGTADFQMRALGISAQHSHIAFTYGAFALK